MTGVAELEALKQWIGRTQTADDIVAEDRVRAMAATLDKERALGSGDVLPLGWHWLFFNPAVRASELGPDGHPERGGFLPPVPLPRRMWAGGRLIFQRSLHVGERLRRESEIADVAVKQGKSGALVFVLVRHRVIGDNGLALEEEHDIVYRPAPTGGSAASMPERALAGAPWRRIVQPDAVLLFRYSALTFNGHRIHYDHPYATKVEGYPGLIVHGPLIATLLLDLTTMHVSPEAVARFAFRALSPLFDMAPFSLNGAPAEDGRSARLWAASVAGDLAMTAEATLR
ncbi:MAG TPA: MaoC family dehydratase N-terminal domain-containing protein [Alphaproteobacteria bacterium]|nr:MaoC family dehydratase N-terminal domain-containing protein [Alphaproteobacteria bacterium]